MKFVVVVVVFLFSYGGEKKKRILLAANGYGMGPRTGVRGLGVRLVAPGRAWPGLTAAQSKTARAIILIASSDPKLILYGYGHGVFAFLYINLHGNSGWHSYILSVCTHFFGTPKRLRFIRNTGDNSIIQ